MKSKILFLLLAFVYQCYCLSDAWLSLPLVAAPDSPRDKGSTVYLGSGPRCDPGETYVPGVHDIESYSFYFAYIKLGNTYDVKNYNSPIVRCEDPNYYPVFFNPHFNNTLRLTRYNVKRAEDGKIYSYAVIYNCYDTDRNGYVYSKCKKRGT
ncbi:hypothetical protein H8356DRAFT_1712614 [Neocallimastix lanati (nom. inval.)]|jgi:hypothetical protein|uniref:Uncharacterized protein n=1 Tax=Neocallimastix californiae TaxID=1754190 RepID=A0A1Y1ZQG2_9FUNG|nr:hypothetical protein H8356DRAFT_1712614 [Neocallimastix sp. JGI-2020a]ORY12483.1 hypothetical protein LY90DRAFT_708718 [Neocallimastix californiae]|eukprot:ORY12483.1 hypothetical protein LY90DRAFT_708718 [Neocallimastix californiae]